MASDHNIADIRKEYRLQTLLENNVDPDPIQQFKKWWDDAIESHIEEVNAMTLATSTKDGRPSARMVLLKEVQDNGFVFFTNYESKKGKNLLENPQASLVFFWKELERQVRIEGIAKKISEKDSDDYFILRPEESKIGAWSSPQSQVISSREILEKNFEKYIDEFADGTILRPPYWGGYVVQPAVIEFWQGRPGRLHDRLQYTAVNDGWKLERLAP
ncbi:MAG: pyridoxamine 5'-phosphate oxidase [Chitinophagaceae bacterium]|nr:pyridoxamine 5'-phosphate oxidase [Chitinophagaceae bacterium]